MLLTARRDTVARVLSSYSGTFRLPVARAERLRVIRIGYAPYEAELDRLNDGRVSVLLSPIGGRLPMVAVRTGPVCPKRADQAEALALWSAATDGLLAMVIAAATGDGRDSLTQLLFRRILDGSGERIVRQSVEHVVTGNVNPIRAGRTPEEFARTGYVERHGETTTFFAPDPEILLDSTFAILHCLSLGRVTREHAGEVGVAFSPARRRDSIPDIQGVLWMTRDPLALKSLEFQYRGVEDALRHAQSGGRLEFETLTNGVPVIRYWHIRAPQLRYMPSGQSTRGRIRVTGAVAVAGERRETGGLIKSGRLSDGTEWSAPLRILRGRVLYSRTEEPVPEARVTLDSTDYESTTDRLGRFSMDAVLPGPYIARVVDSIAVRSRVRDSLLPEERENLVQQVVRRVATVRTEVGSGSAAPVAIRLPWRASVVGCESFDESQPRFVVVGSVVSPDSSALPNAALQFTWADTTRESIAETRIDARADAGAVFLICGVPGGRDLTVLVTLPSGQTFQGRSSVPVVDYYASGRRQASNLRKITLVVPPW